MVRSVMVRALHPLTFRCLRGAAMSAMHEDVHQRTQEEDQEGQPAEQMRSVFEDEKEAGDHEETRQDDIHDRQSTAVSSEEHTSELQSLMRISSAVFSLNKKKTENNNPH